MNRLWRWLPALLWMGVIFTASGGGMSHGQTSRFFQPFLRAIFPRIGEETVELLHFLARKGGHVFEYAVLSILLWWAIGPIRAGNGSRARLAWLLAVSYAATDEFHQMWVPSRMGSVADVALDAVGAALGLAVIVAAGRLLPVFRRGK